MLTFEPHQLLDCFGFGVAGNFAGHLEQAGEASDFANVTAASAEAPKGIFPFYVPGSDSFLGRYPISHDLIAKPVSGGDVKLQLEPEVGLLCHVSYGESDVLGIGVIALGAFNDCSIRRQGAVKISEKKNWGPASKGVASSFFPITDLSPDGPTKSLRLASFLRRNGELHVYGVDSPLPGYSYYGQTLLDWIVERLNHQTGSDNTPLEPVGEYLLAADRPEQLLIGIGATRYTQYGESTFLEFGDEATVVVYDSLKHSPDEVETAIREQRGGELGHASLLSQIVYPG